MVEDGLFTHFYFKRSFLRNLRKGWNDHIQKHFFEDHQVPCFVLVKSDGHFVIFGLKIFPFLLLAVPKIPKGAQAERT